MILATSAVCDSVEPEDRQRPACNRQPQDAVGIVRSRAREVLAQVAHPVIVQVQRGIVHVRVQAIGGFPVVRHSVAVRIRVGDGRAGRGGGGEPVRGIIARSSCGEALQRVTAAVSRRGPRALISVNHFVHDDPGIIQSHVIGDLRTFERDAVAAVAELAGIRAEDRQAQIRNAVRAAKSGEGHSVGRRKAHDEQAAAGRKGRCRRERVANAAIQTPDAVGVLQRDGRRGRVVNFHKLIARVVVRAEVGRMIHDFGDDEPGQRGGVGSVARAQHGESKRPTIRIAANRNIIRLAFEFDHIHDPIRRRAGQVREQHLFARLVEPEAARDRTVKAGDFVETDPTARRDGSGGNSPLGQVGGIVAQIPIG